jgi:UDP-N-acetylmuramoyl-tripeptide--D-alanyl-D-alanine ligase
MFFALKGESFDGNKFAVEALEKGAHCAVVDDPDLPPDDRYFQVRDSLEALQSLAAFHRKNIRAQVIGITGSNGKTTTKELIYSALSAKYKTISTFGNLNNHIGVPLTVLSIREPVEYAVVEMGANHQGEIKALCAISDPDFGIITNIGKAHLEGFGGPEGVVRAKSELYQHIRDKKGMVFVNEDDPLLSSLSSGMNKLTYGTAADADCSGSVISSYPCLTVEFKYGQSAPGVIHSHLAGHYNFGNIMTAVAVGKYFKVDDDLLIRAIGEYIPSNNRSQVRKTERNTLILDAYNANPSSMKAALENFQNLPASPKMVILGDMMELGDFARAEHEEIVGQVLRFAPDKILLIGELFSQTTRQQDIVYFIDTDSAASWLASRNLSGFTILLKGSRKMQLEKLTPYL